MTNNNLLNFEPFQPASGLKHRHLQTIFPSLFRKQARPANVKLEVCSCGGHPGFISGHIFKPQYWLEKRISQYLKT